MGQALYEPGAEKRTRPLVVVNKSTVPVGSGDYVSMLIREGAEEAKAEGRGESSSRNGVVAAGYRVLSSPEFLREGGTVYDSLFPDKVALAPTKLPAVVGKDVLYLQAPLGIKRWRFIMQNGYRRLRLLGDMQQAKREARVGVHHSMPW